MTNERAIELLHRISDSQFDGEYGDERREALEMAVRALEGDGDLISRKQVLNASHFVACWDGVEHFSLEVVDADFIQKLPSVQPTQTNENLTQTNALDCVDRQAAIDMFQRLAYDDWNQGASTTWANAYSEAVDMVRELPSAHPTQTNANSTHENTLDCVSREAAIDAVSNCGICLQKIVDLPSAQPETPCYLGSPCEYQNKDIKLPSAQQDDRLNKIAELIDWYNKSF